VDPLTPSSSLLLLSRSGTTVFGDDYHGGLGVIRDCLFLFGGWIFRPTAIGLLAPLKKVGGRPTDDAGMISTTEFLPAVTPLPSMADTSLGQ
jgi:hypothetical protein